MVEASLKLSQKMQEMVVIQFLGTGMIQDS